MSETVSSLEADDSNLRGVCSDPACAVCIIWQQPGESEADWKQRLQTMLADEPASYRNPEKTCKNGHPKTDANTRRGPRGERRGCRLCKLARDKGYALARKASTC